MRLPDLDQPDDSLGRQDPFVNAVRIWSSLERMRAHGFPEEYIGDVARSMDQAMMRHRSVLVEQYVQAPLFFRTPDLRRQMGLEYWDDGDLLAANDPDRRAT